MLMMSRYHNKEIKNAFLTGIISLIIFLATAFGANALYRKSADEIGDNYKTINVTVLEKIKSRSAKSGTKYYIRGIAEDGHEGTFWVESELYKKLEVGKLFSIYKYEDCYSSTLHSLVSENAGMAYTISYLTAIITAPMCIIFTAIGIVKRIR